MNKLKTTKPKLIIGSLLTLSLGVAASFGFEKESPSDHSYKKPLESVQTPLLQQLKSSSLVANGLVSESLIQAAIADDETGECTLCKVTTDVFLEMMRDNTFAHGLETLLTDTGFTVEVKQEGSPETGMRTVIRHLPTADLPVFIEVMYLGAAEPPVYFQMVFVDEQVSVDQLVRDLAVEFPLESIDTDSETSQKWKVSEQMNLFVAENFEPWVDENYEIRGTLVSFEYEIHK